jgi:hypothetical protein
MIFVELALATAVVPLIVLVGMAILDVAFKKK